MYLVAFHQCMNEDHLSSPRSSPILSRSRAGLKPHQVTQPTPSDNRPALILRSLLLLPPPLLLLLWELMEKKALFTVWILLYFFIRFWIPQFQFPVPKTIYCTVKIWFSGILTFMLGADIKMCWIIWESDCNLRILTFWLRGNLNRIMTEFLDLSLNFDFWLKIIMAINIIKVLPHHGVWTRASSKASWHLTFQNSITAVKGVGGKMEKLFLNIIWC